MRQNGLNRGQPLASYATAIGQGSLAALARIPVKKSVLPFPAHLGWLILSLHKIT